MLQGQRKEMQPPSHPSLVIPSASPESVFDGRQKTDLISSRVSETWPRRTDHSHHGRRGSRQRIVMIRPLLNTRRGWLSPTTLGCFSASSVRSSIAHRYYIPEHGSAVRRIFITHFAMLEIRRQNANLKTSRNNAGMAGSSVRTDGPGSRRYRGDSQTTAVLFLGHQPGSQRRFGTVSPFDPPFTPQLAWVAARKLTLCRW